MYYCEHLFYGRNFERTAGIYCCGKRMNAPAHSFPPAARAYFWILYLQKGSGSYTINGKTFRINENQAFVAFPYRKISYSADVGSIWDLRWVSFSDETVENFLFSLGVTENSPVLTISRPKEAENVLEKLFRSLSPSYRDFPEKECKAIGLAYQFLGLFAESRTRAPSTVAPPVSPVSSVSPVSPVFPISPAPSVMPAKKITNRAVLDAIFYISQNFDRTIGVADVAAAAGLERSYFSRLFKKETGIACEKWLNDFRMEKAAKLLKSGRLNVAETARSSGFSDQFYFSRAFKKHFGVPPSAASVDVSEIKRPERAEISKTK